MGWDVPVAQMVSFWRVREKDDCITGGCEVSVLRAVVACARGSEQREVGQLVEV